MVVSLGAEPHLAVPGESIYDFLSRNPELRLSYVRQAREKGMMEQEPYGVFAIYSLLESLVFEEGANFARRFEELSGGPFTVSQIIILQWVASNLDFPHLLGEVGVSSIPEIVSWWQCVSEHQTTDFPSRESFSKGNHNLLSDSESWEHICYFDMEFIPQLGDDKLADEVRVNLNYFYNKWSYALNRIAESKISLSVAITSTRRILEIDQNVYKKLALLLRLRAIDVIEQFVEIDPATLKKCAGVLPSLLYVVIFEIIDSGEFNQVKDLFFTLGKIAMGRDEMYLVYFILAKVLINVEFYGNLRAGTTSFVTQHIEQLSKQTDSIYWFALLFEFQEEELQKQLLSQMAYPGLKQVGVLYSSLRNAIDLDNFHQKAVASIRYSNYLGSETETVLKNIEYQINVFLEIYNSFSLGDQRFLSVIRASRNIAYPEDNNSEDVLPNGIVEVLDDERRLSEVLEWYDNRVSKRTALPPREFVIYCLIADTRQVERAIDEYVKVGDDWIKNFIYQLGYTLGLADAGIKLVLDHIESQGGMYMLSPESGGNLERLWGQKETLDGSSYPVLTILDVETSDQRLALIKKAVTLWVELADLDDDMQLYGTGYVLVLLELAYELGLLYEPSLKDKIDWLKHQVIAYYKEQRRNYPLYNHYDGFIQFHSYFAVITEERDYWTNADVVTAEEQDEKKQVKRSPEMAEGFAMPLPRLGLFIDMPSRLAVADKQRRMRINKEMVVSDTGYGRLQKKAIAQVQNNIQERAQGKADLLTLRGNFVRQVGLYSDSLAPLGEGISTEEKLLLQGRLSLVMQYFFNTIPDSLSDLQSIVIKFQEAASGNSGKPLETHQAKFLDLILTGEIPHLFTWLVRLSDEDFAKKFWYQASTNPGEAILLMDLTLYEILHTLGVREAEEKIIELIATQNLQSLMGLPEEQVNRIERFIADKGGITSSEVGTAFYQLRRELSSVQVNEKQVADMKRRRLLQSLGVMDEVLVANPGNDFTRALIHKFRYINMAHVRGGREALPRHTVKELLQQERQEDIAYLEAEAEELLDEQRRQKLRYLIVLFAGATPIVILLLVYFLAMGDDSFQVNFSDYAGIGGDPTGQVSRNEAVTGTFASGTSEQQASTPLLPDLLNAEQIEGLPVTVHAGILRDDLRLGFQEIFGIDNSTIGSTLSLVNQQILLPEVNSTATLEEVVSMINAKSTQIRAYVRPIGSYMMPSDWGTRITGVYTLGVNVRFQLNVFGALVLEPGQIILPGQNIVFVEERIPEDVVRVSPNVLRIPWLRMTNLQGAGLQETPPGLPASVLTQFNRVAGLLASGNTDGSEFAAAEEGLVVASADIFAGMPYGWNGFAKLQLNGLSDTDVLKRLLWFIQQGVSPQDIPINCAVAGSGVAGLFDALTLPQFKVGLFPLTLGEQDEQVLALATAAHTYILIPTANGLLIVDMTPSSNDPVLLQAITPQIPASGESGGGKVFINPLADIESGSSYPFLMLVQRFFIGKGIPLGICVILLGSLYFLHRQRKKNDTLGEKIEKQFRNIQIVKEAPIVIPPAIDPVVKDALTLHMDGPEEYRQEISYYITYFDAEFISAVLYIVALGDSLAGSVEKIVDEVFSILATTDINTCAEQVRRFVNGADNLTEEDHSIESRVAWVFVMAEELLVNNAILPKATLDFFKGKRVAKTGYVSVMTDQVYNVIIGTLVRGLDAEGRVNEADARLEQRVRMAKSQLREIFLSRANTVLSRINRNSENYLLILLLRDILNE